MHSHRGRWERGNEGKSYTIFGGLLPTLRDHGEKGYFVRNAPLPWKLQSNVSPSHFLFFFGSFLVFFVVMTKKKRNEQE